MFPHDQQQSREPVADVPEINVRVTRRGFLYDTTREPGDVFRCALKDLALESASAFGWMQPETPEDQAALDRLYDAAQAEHTQALALAAAGR